MKIFVLFLQGKHWLPFPIRQPLLLPGDDRLSLMVPKRNKQTRQEGRQVGSLLCSFGREHKTTMSISIRQRGETIRDGQIVPGVCIIVFYLILF